MIRSLRSLTQHVEFDVCDTVKLKQEQQNKTKQSKKSKQIKQKQKNKQSTRCYYDI